jgi:LytS/YehU family sensor histidine kinase
MIALIVAGGVSWFFYSRARVAQAESTAAAAARTAAESRLKLLESQLEPHMLFNTLANLRVLIGTDAAAAQRMLDHLIAFLRATLAASRSSRHTLADEFARVADYLALIAVRMGPRLVVQLDLPADLRGLAVPPLLLQPLVENAIRHGLEPKPAGGRVEVQARREGQRLLLAVRDTGEGLPAAADTEAGRPADTGFGLTQVRERLRTLHGERASLVLRSACDAEGGAQALINLPIEGEPD